MMDKRGEPLHIGFMVVYTLAFAVVITIFGFMLYILSTTYYSGYLSHSPDLMPRVYAYRAINTCLAYQDNFTERFYPGIIDFQKYSQETLDKCFTTVERTSFNFQLIDTENSIEYDRILVGFGASRSMKDYPVIIRYESNYSSGVLRVGVSG